VSDFSSGLTISFHTASLTTSHFADTSQHVEWHQRRASGAPAQRRQRLEG